MNSRQLRVRPRSGLKNKIFIAFADPLNVLAIDEMRRTTGMEIFPMIATEKSIIEKIREYGNAENPSSQRGSTPHES